MINLRFRLGQAFLFSVLISLAATNASADVRLAASLRSYGHARGHEASRLGMGRSGRESDRDVRNMSASAVTAADGTWRVDLPAVPQNAAAQTLTVTGKNTLTLQDVLVGDVWVASGQSNMDFGIGNDGRAAETIAQANEPQIRLFMVQDSSRFNPKALSVWLYLIILRASGGFVRRPSWAANGDGTVFQRSPITSEGKSIRSLAILSV